MKKSELKQLIREELQKLNENITANSTLSDLSKQKEGIPVKVNGQSGINLIAKKNRKRKSRYDIFLTAYGKKQLLARGEPSSETILDFLIRAKKIYKHNIQLNERSYEKSWKNMTDKEKKHAYKVAIASGNVKDSFEGFSKMNTKSIFNVKTGKPIEISWKQ